jgi:RNA polymerase sigma-70 factor (ECF subfamily)
MSKKTFEHYYETERAGVMSKLKRFSPEDAEDICGEVFTRAYKYFKSYDSSKAPFGAWLSGITYNCVQSFEKDRIMRQQVITKNLSDLPEFMEPSYDDNSVEAQQHIDAVVKRIEDKAQPTCDVLYLKHVMGHSTIFIAKKLDLKYATVRQTISRFNKEIGE